MGSHTSKNKAEETSNNLPFLIELNSYVACKLDADLQVFDKSLEARTKNVMASYHQSKHMCPTLGLEATFIALVVSTLKARSARRICTCLVEARESISSGDNHNFAFVEHNTRMLLVHRSNWMRCSLMLYYFRSCCIKLNYCSALDKQKKIENRPEVATKLYTNFIPFRK